MKKFCFAILFVTSICLISVSNLSAQDNTTRLNNEALKNLEPYPLTVDSLERHVIILEPKSDEYSYKIEIAAGKLMEVDCNSQSLTGEFITENVQGWGYPYYVFETNGMIISTMMACFGPKETKFVTGESQMIRYNSRLPIVVYLPKGLDLEYRIWTAGEPKIVDSSL